MTEETEKELSPIVLFTYNRPWHTEQTLNALKNNELASESTLYIYCDAAKENTSQESIDKIDAVRKIVRKKQWCKEVHIVEAETNKGLAKSIKQGVTEIVQKYGKVIVMEDDLLTSPAFLSYMNKALDFYTSRKTVYSISAYCMPPNKLQIPEDYQYDVFVGLRNSSWGWATWKDRWEQIEWEVPVYETIAKNPQIKEAFNRGGDDVFELLDMQQSGKLNIWSIQFTVAHFINHGISIIPTKSYVDNIGFDGSGENCSTSIALKNEELSQNKNPLFLDILYQDKRIINSFYNANCRKIRPLWQKIINRLSRILGGKSVFILKKKIYI